MRFGLVHRVMTDALAVLGILAVVSTATLGPWTTVALLAGLVAALAIPESWQSRALFRHAATTGMLLLFVVSTARLVAGQAPIDVMVEFAALLQIVRLATRRGAAHDQQIIVLALLHFVAGTVLGGGLAYGLCFLGFLVVAPGALVLSHLRREVEGNYRQGARDRTGLPVDVPRILRSRRVVGRGFLASTCLISVPIFLFTALLFVLFPRVGLSLLLLNHNHGDRMIGFTDHVKLNEVGTLRTNSAMALRFEAADTPDPPPARMLLRLRGTAFDTYDGVAWARTSSERQPASRRGDLYPLFREPRKTDRKISFDVEPIDPPVIFLPSRTVTVRLKPQSQSVMSDAMTLQKGAEGEVRYTGGDSRGVRYDAYVAPDNEIVSETLSPQDRARYLAVPPLPDRIAKLAHAWADSQPTSWHKAHAIEEHLRHDFRYDVASPSGAAPQPLDDFLFVSKRGHCEFFSTAMAMMLRDVGIPSRNVTGFVGGTYNRFGHYYAVREGDAHSWVEAYIDDTAHPAWLTFDPTPAAGAQPLGDTTGAWVYVRDLIEAVSQRWNHYVVNYDLRTQWRLLEMLQGGGSTGKSHGFLRFWKHALVALAAGAVAFALWRRRRRRSKAPEPTDKTRPSKAMEQAAMLYRNLEMALASHGLARAPSLPPLRFAEELRARSHPLGAEVLDLTQIYLGARFGGDSLSEDTLRGFDKRVRAVRAWKPAEASS